MREWGREGGRGATILPERGPSTGERLEAWCVSLFRPGGAEWCSLWVLCDGETDWHNRAR